MRPTTKYNKGELMGNCIFLEERESMIKEFKGKNNIRFVKRIGLFKCSCGKEFEAAITYIRNGSIKSCGCLAKERIRQQGLKNKTHGLRSNPLYSVWFSMLSRCENKKDNNYHRYGGRGITVCDRWHNLSNFIEDMENNYHKGLQIDRKDNDGNYCPENCRWITRTQNANNTRRNRFITYDGKTMTVAEWSRFLNVPIYLLYGRLKKFSDIDALTLPYKKYSKNLDKD